MLLEIVEATVAPHEHEAVAQVGQAAIQRAQEQGGLVAAWLTFDQEAGTLVGVLVWRSEAEADAVEPLRVRAQAVAEALGQHGGTRVRYRRLQVESYLGPGLDG